MDSEEAGSEAGVVLEGLLEVVPYDGLQVGAFGAVECVREAIYYGRGSLSFCKIYEEQGNGTCYEQKRNST